MIGTVFKSQKELLDAIDEIHLGGEGFELDLTFGDGGIHKGRRRPERCFDKVPKFDFVEKRDCLDTGIATGSVRSVVFDPPFLAGGGASGVMHGRYSSFRNIESLYDFYEVSLVEIARILKKNGIAVFKCQDINNGRTQGFSHCEIYKSAIGFGLYALDLFVFQVGNRMKPHNLVRQKHARKTHSYFWVFKKCERKNYVFDRV